MNKKKLVSVESMDMMDSHEEAIMFLIYDYDKMVSYDVKFIENCVKDLKEDRDSYGESDETINNIIASFEGLIKFMKEEGVDMIINTEW